MIRKSFAERSVTFEVQCVISTGYKAYKFRTIYQEKLNPFKAMEANHNGTS